MRCSVCDWSPSDSESVFNSSIPKAKRRIEKDKHDETVVYEHRRQIVLDKQTNDTICTECLHEIYFEEVE